MASPETQLDAIYLNRKALETLNMPTVTLNLPDNYIPWMEKKRIEFGVKSRHAFILLAIRELAKVPMLVPEEIDRSGWPLIEQRFICSECSGSAVRGSKHCGGGVKGIANDDVEKQRIRGICVCPVCSGTDAKIVYSEAKMDAIIGQRQWVAIADIMKALGCSKPKAEEFMREYGCIGSLNDSWRTKHAPIIGDLTALTEADKQEDMKAEKRRDIEVKFRDDLSEAIDDLIEGHDEVAPAEIIEWLDLGELRWPPFRIPEDTLGNLSQRMRDVTKVLDMRGWNKSGTRYRMIADENGMQAPMGEEFYTRKGVIPRKNGYEMWNLNGGDNGKSGKVPGKGIV